jgi:hypothetical protein
MFGIELLGAIGLIAVGGALLWKAFGQSAVRRESEIIVIETTQPGKEP